MKIVETTKEQCEACGLPTRANAQLAGASGWVYHGHFPQITIGVLSDAGEPMAMRFTCARCGYQWEELKETAE